MMFGHSISAVLKKNHRKLHKRYVEYLKRHNPRKYANVLYQQKFGYGIDWKQPRDLNEWINYLAFKTDTSEWSRLADKFAVRDYVASKGLSDLLIPLYGVWENANNIDFDSLPDSFVIKTNHASGDSILVFDKVLTDLDLVREKLRASLLYPCGLESAEPHYLKIKPLVLAEQLLPPPQNDDIKVWCFHGQPDCVMTVSNRNIEKETGDLCVYDLNWEKHNDWLTEHYRNGIETPKPQQLDEILEYAKILSKGFAQVRVDFYNAFGKVFFGEMTFTSNCGRMKYFTQERLTAMGEKIKAGFHDNIH